MKLTLSVVAGVFSICRLPANADIPLWPMQSEFFTVTRTGDELSIVCEERHVRQEEPGLRVEPGWRALKLHGPIPSETTGVIASLTRPLAEAGISVSPIATFDTDYLFVKNESLVTAIETLRRAGFAVIEL